MLGEYHQFDSHDRIVKHSLAEATLFLGRGSLVKIASTRAGRRRLAYVELGLGQFLRAGLLARCQQRKDFAHDLSLP